MLNTQHAIKQFYDTFDQKLLTDYVRGNPRMLAAIHHTLGAIPAGATSVLDIGCGIGWSSWEIKRHYPDAWVLGVDISQVLIQTARTLFAVPGLEFIVSDVTSAGSLPRTYFDAIILLDVYEHIPRQERKGVHSMLRRLLNDHSVLILTCPSTLHQDYLRTHKPEGLQPVDEDVTLADVMQLAHDLEGEVMCFTYQTIWRTNDYTHTVIQRKPRYQQPYAQQKQTGAITIEPQHVRHQRVKTRLQRDIPLPRQQHPGMRLVRRVGRPIKHAVFSLGRRLETRK